MSGINIKKTQDCYKNFLYNTIRILHIHTASWNHIFG